MLYPVRYNFSASCGYFRLNMSSCIVFYPYETVKHETVKYETANLNKLATHIESSQKTLLKSGCS